MPIVSKTAATVSFLGALTMEIVKRTFYKIIHGFGKQRTLAKEKAACSNPKPLALPLLLIKT